MSTILKTKKAIQLTKALYKSRYTIVFSFSNGKISEIDFYPFLSKPNQHADVRKYLDTELFKKFSITLHGDIEWNDYEMCFPFENLYTGDI